MDIHNLTAKDIKKLHIWLRVLIQVLYFLFIPSVYTAAFAGVKYIFTQIGAGEKVAVTSFVTVLVVICIYTILFGRFFCGFACAFGTLGDGVHALYVWICKKMKKKPLQIADAWTEKLCYLKYIVLALISILCFAGVYGKGKGTSPWYLFCRNFFPMGAVFSLLPVFPFFALHRDRENCIKGCKACTKKCPSNIGLPEDGSPKVEGDCFQCQKCIDTCPKGNIHTGVKGLRGNEFWFTILRAVILLILLLWLGV